MIYGHRKALSLATALFTGFFFSVALQGCGSGSHSKSGGGDAFSQAGESSSSDAIATQMTDGGSVAVKVPADQKAEFASATIQLIRKASCPGKMFQVLYRKDNGEHRGNGPKYRGFEVIVPGHDCSPKQIIKNFALKDPHADLAWNGIEPGSYLLIVTLFDADGNAKEAGQKVVSIQPGETAAASVTVHPVQTDDDGNLKVSIKESGDDSK